MTDLPSEELSRLLNRIAAGDEQAVTAVYRHYRGFLHAFVRRQLADAATAEEVVQDTFFDALRWPQRYQGQAKFSTWLCSIASHKAIDRLRKHGRQPAIETLDDDIVENIADPDGDFTAALEDAELHEWLARCIEALPPAHKEALFWAFFDDERIEDVAVRQGCPPGTVKSRLFHARQKLRACLKDIFGSEVPDA
jgi:RNA polymerase sigma-70 factor (ECF subfamily)